MSFLLGIDVGTRACKVLLFDLDGSVVAESISEYYVSYPEPAWAEQDPDLWWKATVHSINNIFEKFEIPNNEIVGIGVDSQREAVTPINRRGRKIGNSIIWLDRRTLPQAERIRKLFSEEEILRITGLPIGYIFSASKILWLMENRPDIFRETRRFLFPKDYITYRLTGEMVTDFSMASRTLLFDINKKSWSSDVCKVLEIDETLLPEIKESGKIIGEVTEDAGRETKLRTGTPVVAGGGDRPCEALGAGVINVGQINIGTGTGTTITTPLSSPKPDSSGRIACCCHVVKNFWEYEAGISTTGASLRWFKENFEDEGSKLDDDSDEDAYTLLERSANEVPPGSEGLFFYPYLSGAHAPYYNDHARGVFLGITLGHKKAHFVRAIFEGVACQYPETFNLLKNLSVEINEVRMVGRETMIGFWNQLKSDVTGEIFIVPRVKDSAALGSAILAGIGTGVYRDEKEAVERLVRIDRKYEPDKCTSKKYEKILREYDTAYRKMEKVFRK